MTSTPPAHLSEREMLVRAIYADPADDTPRLVYADWLESRDTVYVKCPTCTTPITVEVNESFAPSARYVRQFPHSCPVCTGRGEIPDDTDARHGELIRVQCELARVPGDYTHTLIAQDDNGKRGRVWLCECRVCKARDRESALLPALRDRLLPKCPMCEGSKIERYTDAAGDTDTRACSLCRPAGEGYMEKGSGRCPGTFDRGLPVATVPLAVLGEESDRACDGCRGHGKLTVLAELPPFNPLRLAGVTMADRVKTREVDCPHCNGIGSRPYFKPSDFASACVRAGVGMRPSDREPGEANHNGYQWLNNPPWSEDDQRDGLPTSLFLMLDGARYEDEFMKWYPTAAAAVRALSSTLWRCAVAGA